MPAPMPGWAGADLSLLVLTYFLGSISSGTHVQLISPWELVLAPRARVSSRQCGRVVPASLLLVTLLCSANTVLAWLGSTGYDCSLPWSWNPPPAIMLPFLRFPSFAEKVVAEDGHPCLQDGHLLPGSFQLDSSAERKQRYYCAAGLVMQLKP